MGRIYTFSDGSSLREKQHYISSLLADQIARIGQSIRGHWDTENRLHWQLDVTFGEDACRARKGYSATNLNTFRKFTLAKVAQKKDKLSIKKRLFKAARNPQDLKEPLKI